MSKKAKLIEEFLKTPMGIGQWIEVKGIKYDKEKAVTCVIKTIKEDDTYIVTELSGSSTLITISKNQIVSRSTFHIGGNNFSESVSRLRFVAFSLECIVGGLGYDRRKKVYQTENFGKVEVDEVNWNPTIKDKDGNNTCYQRDFIWDLKDKQLLIESIYQGLDIGKVVIKKNSYEYVERETNLGNKVNFKDIVDGKQRLKAILDFVMDKFEDLHGNTFSELSNKAQSNFLSFQGVAYGELDEGTTDEEIQSVFLKINFTGVQMSQEHINFVKSIQLK